MNGRFDRFDAAVFAAAAAAAGACVGTGAEGGFGAAALCTSGRSVVGAGGSGAGGAACACGIGNGGGNGGGSGGCAWGSGGGKGGACICGSGSGGGKGGGWSGCGGGSGSEGGSPITDGRAATTVADCGRAATRPAYVDDVVLTAVCSLSRNTPIAISAFGRTSARCTRSASTQVPFWLCRSTMVQRPFSTCSSAWLRDTPLLASPSTISLLGARPMRMTPSC